MGDAVRLQYDPDLPKELLTQLIEELELSGEDLYPGKGFTAFTDLFQLYGARAYSPTERPHSNAAKAAFVRARSRYLEYHPKRRCNDSFIPINHLMRSLTS